MGYLTITIGRAHWMNYDNGTECSISWRFCMFYVKIAFDNGSHFSTRIEKSSGRKGIGSYNYPAYFHQQFKSGEIRGNSPVKFEVWSSPYIGNDTLLHVWNTNVDELLENGKHVIDDDNWIETSSVWKDHLVTNI